MSLALSSLSNPWSMSTISHIYRLLYMYTLFVKCYHRYAMSKCVYVYLCMVYAVHVCSMCVCVYNRYNLSV